MLRFIPAYAGNTYVVLGNLYLHAVHPRVCGEHPVEPIILFQSSGSSPRMRGTRCELRRKGAMMRFIPAYAGNTAMNTEEFRFAEVHPRVCGEHFKVGSSFQSLDGSSPRMRGTHKERDNDQRIHRFIPAYAGNTVGRLSR